jgi:hypothetical protein
MGLCWIPRGRSVKARDVVILLFLHVLYMYVVSITIGDVYNDGVVTGNSSFATSHVRPFHAWMRAKELGGKRQDGNGQDRLVLRPCWGSSADGLDHSHWWVKVFVENRRVCQPSRTAVSRREMRLREGLGDACNHVLQSGITRKRKKPTGCRVRARS